jgi:hypothetical protein
MKKLATIKVGDSAEADVGMRANIDTLTGNEFCRSRLIEENEGTDHLPLWRRQGAAHLEITEVARARDDQRLDRIDAYGVRASGLQGWVPTHVIAPFALTPLAQSILLRSKLACDLRNMFALEARAGQLVFGGLTRTVTIGDRACTIR